MERSELVRRLVLDEISDDYENVDQTILPNVGRDGAKLGLSIERSDIVDALDRLITDGLAKAYFLSGPESKELQGMPPLDVVEEHFTTYFYLTQKGMDFHLADDTWWPFHEEGTSLA